MSEFVTNEINQNMADYRWKKRQMVKMTDDKGYVVSEEELK